MSKRNSPIEDMFILFLILFVIAAIIIALGAPIFLPLYYLYNKFKSQQIMAYLNGNESDFWLTENEKITFKQKVIDFIEAKEIIKEANRQGEEAGISRNKDGSFSARSKLGKKLKAIINKYEPIKNQLEYEIEKMEIIPRLRWNEFNSYLRNELASKKAFIVWIIILIYTKIAYGINLLSLYITLGQDVIYFFSSTPSRTTFNDIVVLFLTSLSTVIAFFVFKALNKYPAEKYTPKPGIVTIENVDNY